MADNGHISLIRGSTDLHLTPEGRNGAIETGKAFSRLGGCPWRVYTSPQARALETAHGLTLGCLSTVLMAPDEGLASWYLGGYEGQEKSKVLPQIQDLVANRPWIVPPGMGEKSTRSGECFLDFKNRVLVEVKRLIDLMEQHPTKRIMVVTHFHCINLIRAWLAKYLNEPRPIDVGYSAKVYNQDIGNPGDTYSLYKKGDKITFADFHVDKAKDVPPGIYICRHQMTLYN